jgi:hypothetical protein
MADPAAGRERGERNARVAGLLRAAASLLEAQGGEPFRARAFQRAADTVAGLEDDVGERFAREGPEGLEKLPGIGRGIAAAIAEILITGRWARLDRMRGELDPVQLFRTVPGIGPALAERIHDVLHVDTLEALEAAAYDGRLAQVPGIGARRAAALAAVLDVMLRRVRGARRARDPAPVPVETLLDVDAEYHRRAERGELPRIAPRRFNPGGERWLPVLHTDRGPWHFTALFSNTARAHELGRTRDWVVLYLYDGDHHEHQCTVVTEPRGPLAGRRVVRGREDECRAWYRSRERGAA